MHQELLFFTRKSWKKFICLSECRSHHNDGTVPLHCILQSKLVVRISKHTTRFLALPIHILRPTWEACFCPSSFRMNSARLVDHRERFEEREASMVKSTIETPIELKADLRMIWQESQQVLSLAFSYLVSARMRGVMCTPLLVYQGNEAMNLGTILTLHHR